MIKNFVAKPLLNVSAAAAAASDITSNGRRNSSSFDVDVMINKMGGETNPPQQQHRER